MKTRKTILAISTIPLLALGACAEETNEPLIKQSEVTNQEQFEAYQSQQAQKLEDEKVDPAEIGEAYTWDCTQNSPCEMKIKVTEITPVIPCPYGSYSDTPGEPGKKYVLMKGELEGIKTENFHNVSNFEQINKEGFTESIIDGASCMNPPGESWGTDIHQGEKKRVSGIFELPSDAEKISIQGLYFYDVPDVDPITPGDAREPEWMSDDDSESETFVEDESTTYPTLPNGAVDEGAITDMFWDCMNAGGTADTCRQ